VGCGAADHPAALAALTDEERQTLRGLLVKSMLVTPEAEGEPDASGDPAAD
jgi:hypothetical protein